MVQNLGDYGFVEIREMGQRTSVTVPVKRLDKGCVFANEECVFANEECVFANEERTLLGKQSLYWVFFNNILLFKEDAQCRKCYLVMEDNTAESFEMVYISYDTDLVVAELRRKKTVRIFAIFYKEV